MNLPYRSVGCRPVRRGGERAGDGGSVVRRRLARPFGLGVSTRKNRPVLTQENGKKPPKKSRHVFVIGRRVGRGTPPEGPRDHREAQERGRTGRIFLAPRSADFSDAVERPAARAPLRIRRAVGRHAELPSAAVAPRWRWPCSNSRPRRPRRPLRWQRHPAGAFHPQSTSRRGRSVAEIPSMPTATRLVRAAGLRQIPRRRQVLMLRSRWSAVGRQRVQAKVRLCFRCGGSLFASPVPRRRARTTHVAARVRLRERLLSNVVMALRNAVSRAAGPLRAMAVGSASSGLLGLEVAPRAAARGVARARATTAVVTSWKTKSTTGRVRRSRWATECPAWRVTRGLRPTPPSWVTRTSRTSARCGTGPCSRGSRRGSPGRVQQRSGAMRDRRRGVRPHLRFSPNPRLCPTPTSARDHRARDPRVRTTPNNQITHARATTIGRVMDSRETESVPETRRRGNDPVLIIIHANPSSLSLSLRAARRRASDST